MIQKGDISGLDHDVDNTDKICILDHLLRVELLKFVGSFDVVGKRKKLRNDLQISDLSRWKDGTGFNCG